MEAAMIASATLGAASTYSESRAKAQEQLDQAKRKTLEAELVGTQAVQRENANREEMASFIGATKSARVANGMSVNSPNAIAMLNSARTEMGRTRILQGQDARMQAGNLHYSALAYQKGAKRTMTSGILRSAITLGQGAYNQWGGGSNNG